MEYSSYNLMLNFMFLAKVNAHTPLTTDFIFLMSYVTFQTSRILATRLEKSFKVSLLANYIDTCR